VPKPGTGVAEPCGPHPAATTSCGRGRTLAAGEPLVTGAALAEPGREIKIAWERGTERFGATNVELFTALLENTMNRTVLFAVVASVACLSRNASAEERHEGPARPAEGGRPARQPPPKFEAHPPGAHPQGPTVKQHPVRVLAPRVVSRVHRRAWTHWDHPDFPRPAYYWNWSIVHSVTCTAEDSYGDQYPVTEAAGRGFGFSNMTTVEDDAIDRCYAESGRDTTCSLLTCTHS
jgi:hypothetical protein